MLLLVDANACSSHVMLPWIATKPLQHLDSPIPSSLGDFFDLSLLGPLERLDLAPPQELIAPMRSRPQPEDCSNQIKPNSMSHERRIQMLGRIVRVGPNIYLGEDTKNDEIKQKDDEIPGEGEEGLDKGDQVDESGDGGNAGDDDGEEAVLVLVDVLGGEAFGVDAGDSKGEDELEEADEDAGDGCDHFFWCNECGSTTPGLVDGSDGGFDE